MAFLVACLVYAYVHKAVETLRDVGFEILPDEVNQPPDRLPVDFHELGDSLPAEAALDHPRSRVGEVEREPRAVLRPRHGGRQHAVLRAAHPRHPRTEPHHHGAEVHAAPEALFRQIVVNIALLAADWASPPVFLLDVDMRGQRNLTVGALSEIHAVDGRPLDIEELL